MLSTHAYPQRESISSVDAQRLVQISPWPFFLSIIYIPLPLLQINTPPLLYTLPSLSLSLSLLYLTPLILSFSLSLSSSDLPPPHTCTPQDYIRLNVNVRQQQKSVNLEVQVSTILSLFTASETHFNTQ